MINQDMPKSAQPRTKSKSLKNQMPNIYSGFLDKCPSQLKTFLKKLKIRNKCNAFFFLLLICYTALNQQEFTSLKRIIDKILQKKISFKTDRSKRDIQKYERSLVRLQKYQNIIGRIFTSSKLQNLQKWEQLLAEALKQQNWVNKGLQVLRSNLKQQVNQEWLDLKKRYQLFLEKVEEVYGSIVKSIQILKYFPIDDKQAENQDIQIIYEEQSGNQFGGGEYHNFDQYEKQQTEALVPQEDKKLDFDFQADKKLVIVQQTSSYDYDQFQGYFLEPGHPYVIWRTNIHLLLHNRESQKPTNRQQFCKFTEHLISNISNII